MKYFILVFSLTISMLFLVGQASAQNQTQPQLQIQNDEYFRTPAPDTAKAYIFQAGTAKKHTFLLNKYDGSVYILTVSDGKRIWKKTTVNGKLPNLPDKSQVNYQIFLSQSGQEGFYLLCLETGDTWFMTTDADKNFVWELIGRTP